MSPSCTFKGKKSQQKPKPKKNVGLHNHCPLLTMITYNSWKPFALSNFVSAHRFMKQTLTGAIMSNVHLLFFCCRSSTSIIGTKTNKTRSVLTLIIFPYHGNSFFSRQLTKQSKSAEPRDIFLQTLNFPNIVYRIHNCY